jgi:hypothetical protein
VNGAASGGPHDGGIHGTGKTNATKMSVINTIQNISIKRISTPPKIVDSLNLIKTSYNLQFLFLSLYSTEGK